MNTFYLGKGKATTLHELFIDQLRNLYSAEIQLIEALPGMAEAAHEPVLKQDFEAHLEESLVHLQRLEQIFNDLGEEPIGNPSRAMEELIREGKKTIRAEATPEVKDAGLIAAVQRVEQYEIASYGAVRTYADLLGHGEMAVLLQSTMDEEAAMDKKLSALAESLNVRAPVDRRQVVLEERNR